MRKRLLAAALPLLLLDALDDFVERAGIGHLCGEKRERHGGANCRDDRLSAEHAASNAGATNENFLY